jgi:hypothetical protein
MSFCTACGTKNPVDARFCRACGHAMEASSDTLLDTPSSPVASPSKEVPRVDALPTLDIASVKLKAFDNPAELWKMYFYVSFFNIGAYFLTNSAADFLEDSGGFLSLPMGLFALFILAFMGLAYWLIKKQAVDKGRTLWLLPLIAWQVYAYLDGLSGFDPGVAESSFDYYDAYISGIPETIILIRLFLALRER